MSAGPSKPNPQQTYYHHRNRRVLIPDGMMAVGLIVGAHGLRGEVRIEPHTDFPDRFSPGNTILMGVDLVEMRIVASRPHKGLHLVLFDGIASRTAAEGVRGNWLFIPEEDASPLDEDVYWIHDLVGMQVEDTGGRILGTVRNVMPTGANDVYLIDPAPGVNRDQEILLPAIADVIKRVDVDARRIVVDLMPGLLDEPEEVDMNVGESVDAKADETGEEDVAGESG